MPALSIPTLLLMCTKFTEWTGYTGVFFIGGAVAMPSIPPFSLAVAHMLEEETPIQAQGGDCSDEIVTGRGRYRGCLYEPEDHAYQLRVTRYDISFYFARPHERGEYLMVGALAE